MKKLLFLFLLVPALANSQNLYISGRLGIANYQGDLKAKSVSFSQSKMLGSLGVRYDFSDHVTGRSYLTLTALQADDKNGTPIMQDRNLNFRSKIFEWEIAGQYNLFSFNEKWWTPYVFAGIGFFHFNPYTYDQNNAKVFLQPLSTEGEGFASGVKKYKLTQFCIPVGLGAEYSINEDMRIGAEFGFRKLFTDYLDDVSNVYVDQTALLNARGPKAVELAWRGDEKTGNPYPPAGYTRGNPKYKDAYYYIAITFTRRLIFNSYKEIAGLPAGKKQKRSGCPANRY